jgi:NADH-quinone oxidoreductase subunit E
MSVRRLADEAVQPTAFAFSRENSSWAKKRIGLYPKGREQSAVIPLLMRAQEQEGWVSRVAIETIAEMLNMPYIRVLEVATFYTQFQLQPVGTKAHVQVCGTTPCMLRGAEGLRSVCQKKIHAEAHHTNADGTLSWEEVECAGACVNAPMVTIGMDTYEDLTPERLEEIIDAFEAGKGDTIEPGPQNGRKYSAPLTGQTTLTAVPDRSKSRATGKGAKAQAATKPGRKRTVSAEAAPAVKGPAKSAKVSTKKAETERKATAKSAKANGKPNRAARPKATGAESKGGKIDGGAAVGKKTSAAKTALFIAPKGKADDLKLISGVGPVLEKKLNAFGVTQFAQVAKFKKADIVKLDDALSFKGRIERDEWVKQAKALAKGGEAEYIRVFGKKPR